MCVIVIMPQRQLGIADVWSSMKWIYNESRGLFIIQHPPELKAGSGAAEDVADWFEWGKRNFTKNMIALYYGIIRKNSEENCVNDASGFGQGERKDSKFKILETQRVNQVKALWIPAEDGAPNQLRK